MGHIIGLCGAERPGQDSDRPPASKQKWWEWKQAEDYSCVIGIPELQISLSHTRMGLGLCYGALGKTSVGVDLEWETRVIKPGIEKFFKNSSDNELDFSTLEIWSRKEAAFKALSPRLKKNLGVLTLKRIWLNSQGEFGLDESPQVWGKTHRRTLFWEGENLMISSARIGL